jgi:glycosyltransferase involved in cell wall biosynthesis
MRIRVDATSLLLRSAGVKTYLHYWLRYLTMAAGRHGHHVDTYPPGLRATLDLDHNRSVSGPVGTAWRLALVHFVNIRSNPALNLFLAGVDVFHCSQHSAQAPKWKKITATLFDMSCWTTPQFHTPENIAATRRYGERILKNCDGIIAISEHARREAIDILKIPADRIATIYPGVPEPFFSVTPAEAARVRETYRLTPGYLLFVGCVEPRKNVAGLIRAYRSLPQSLQQENQLVIAGPFGWKSDEVQKVLAATGPNVRYLGYVDEPDLPGLFAGAGAFVYPSFYEGFGLPVAQAMAAGVPVITSDRSCLPEVTGGAGICVDPESVDQLAAAMHDVLSDAELSGRLRTEGRSRAGHFRWATSADQSLGFFERIAGR